MFSSTTLGISIIICCKEIDYFLKKLEPIMPIKKHKILAILSNTEILSIMQIILKLTGSIFKFSNNLNIYIYIYIYIYTYI